MVTGDEVCQVTLPLLEPSGDVISVYVTESDGHIVVHDGGHISALLFESRRNGPTRQAQRTAPVILTTHSPDLLCDQGIDGWEVLCITTGKNGSIVESLAADSRIREVLKAGVMPGEIAPFRNQAVQLPMHLGLSA